MSNRLFPYVPGLVDRTTKRFGVSERKLREGIYGAISSLIYVGACPWGALNA